MFRLRFYLLALILLACKRDETPESGTETAVVDTAPRPAETRMEAPAEAPAAARRGRLTRSDTSRYIDSVRVGDTVSYERGFRIVMTVVESTWTRRPPLALGIPSGPFHLPIDSLCRQQTLGYNGAYVNANAATLQRDLARVKACKGRVIIGMMRTRLKPAGVDTGLSVARAKAEIDSWPDIGSYIRDSTVIAIYMGDDILSNEWGTAPFSVKLAQWDSIYGLVHAPHRWPGAATVIRAKPTELKKWGWKGRHLTTAWAQYRGPHRDKHPRDWMREEVASARQQQLGLVIGVNLLDGGCGPPVLESGEANTSCLPNVPGTGILGTYSNSATARRFQVSPAEYLFYKTIFLAEPYNCASIDWQWSTIWGAGRPQAQLEGARSFHTRSEVKAASRSLGVIARTRPYTSCIQRG
jgi:hypothetical protein